MDSQLDKKGEYFQGSFRAMASPCEVLVCSSDQTVAREISEICHKEATRIEAKFSRYINNNIIGKINSSSGQPIEVDEETAKLLDFAAAAYELSGGRFDITSGVLRKLWKFDGSENVPSRNSVKKLLDRIGWQKVSWDGSQIILEKDMEIDFGGFGKEYAVDSSMSLVREKFSEPVMVNYGGDLVVNREPTDKKYWSVGVEKVGDVSLDNIFRLQKGAIATSGDANRYLMKRGKKLSHVLNPRTGWPVSGAASSITVSAGACLEAGFLATTAMLMGPEAENFLKTQEVKHYIQRNK